MKKILRLFLLLSCIGVMAMWVRILDHRTPPPIAEPTDDGPNMSLFRGSGPSFAEQVVELVNAERLNMGRSPLKAESLLNTSSLDHSTNMGIRNFFAHCDVDTNLDPFERMNNAGYFFTAAAENIAAGQNTPAAVMAEWMNSSGHRANILNPNFREIGVGFFFDGSDTGNVRRDDNGDCVADSFNHGPFHEYWTQNFGSRSNVFPLIINNEDFETDSIDVDLFIYGQGTIIDMRIRNDNGSFGAWMPYTQDVAWQINPIDGFRSVEAELRNAAMQVFTTSDTILLADFFSCSMPSNSTMWPSFNILPFVACVSP